MTSRFSLLLFLLVLAPCAAQPAKPTPTPKEKIVHPSAVIFPTSARLQEEELKVKFEKISLPDALDFLEAQSGQKFLLQIQRPAAQILLDVSIYGPKSRALHMMRTSIENQAQVRFEAMGGVWMVVDRDKASTAEAQPATPVTPGKPGPRPHPIISPLPGVTPTPVPTPTPTR